MTGGNATAFRWALLATNKCRLTNTDGCAMGCGHAMADCAKTNF